MKRTYNMQYFNTNLILKLKSAEGYRNRQSSLEYSFRVGIRYLGLVMDDIGASGLFPDLFWKGDGEEVVSVPCVMMSTTRKIKNEKSKQKKSIGMIKLGNKFKVDKLIIVDPKDDNGFLPVNP